MPRFRHVLVGSESEQAKSVGGGAEGDGYEYVLDGGVAGTANCGCCEGADGSGVRKSSAQARVDDEVPPECPAPNEPSALLLRCKSRRTRVESGRGFRTK